MLDAQIEWLQAEALTGGYELAADRADDPTRTYAEVAALVGAAPDEIALVENATFAWHQAFWSLGLRPGDRVLTANAEYASGFVSMLQATRAARRAASRWCPTTSTGSCRSRRWPGCWTTTAAGRSASSR